MKTSKIEELLQKYFNGESTTEEERALENYFQTGEVAEELLKYKEFFIGIAALPNTIDDSSIEEEVMEYILENEHKEKTKYRWLWQTVTGIAASVVIVLGGLLFFQQQKPFEETFKDPNEAYAYAQQTLQYVSGKYNKGLAELSSFQKLNKATQPIKRGINPVNNFYNSIQQMEKVPALSLDELSEKKGKSNDSI